MDVSSYHALPPSWRLRQQVKMAPGGTVKSIFSFKNKAPTPFELNLYSYEDKWAICLEELSTVLCPLAVRSASCGMDGDVKRKQQGGSSTGSQELSGQGSDSHAVG